MAVPGALAEASVVAGELVPAGVDSLAVEHPGLLQDQAVVPAVVVPVDRCLAPAASAARLASAEAAREDSVVASLGVSLGDEPASGGLAWHR